MTIETITPGDIVVHDRTGRKFVYSRSCLAKLGDTMEWTEAVLFYPVESSVSTDKPFVRDKANFQQKFSKATE